MRMHGRRRREPDSLADLAYGRWIAVVVYISDDVVPDLLLPRGQHTGSSLWANMCSSTVPTRADGVKGRQSALERT